MNYLDQWIASIEEHLNSVTSEELEERYLAVRDGCGPTIEQYLSYNQQTLFVEKNIFLTGDKVKFVSVERVTLKFSNVPVVDNSFSIAVNDSDYSMAA